LKAKGVILEIGNKYNYLTNGNCECALSLTEVKKSFQFLFLIGVSSSLQSSKKYPG
jgi:hypothetical protein